jgi:DNA end-binding protein Ku
MAPAPRANWKGYLRLSLVSCPIMLFPAASESEKIRFNLINKKTGNRIHMQKVDAETGEPVPPEDIVNGYKAGDKYVEIADEDLEAIDIESSRTIDIDEFVPRQEIDDRYFVRPYYIVPDGKVGEQAFAVIREAIRKKAMVALGRVVLSTREHVIMLEPRGAGLVGTLLRYPYELRKEDEYFRDIAKVETPKEMIDLAAHIIDTKAGHFQPEKFEDRYENALRDLVKRKLAGEKIVPARHAKPKPPADLMAALKASLGQSRPSERLRARRPVAHPRPPTQRRPSRRQAG